MKARTVGMMRTCEHCSTPVGDDWEHCLRCGEELPPPPPAGPTLLERLRILVTRSGERGSVPNARGLLPSAPALPAALTEARVPAWTLAVALVAVVGAVMFGLSAVATAGADPRIAEERDAAQAEVARLSEALTTIEQERDLLAADLETAEERLAGIEQELAELTADLEAARTQSEERGADLELLRAQVDELTASAQESAGRVAALTDCLDGTQVAYEFAREGLIPAADLAMQSVSQSCAAARGG